MNVVRTVVVSIALILISVVGVVWANASSSSKASDEVPAACIEIGPAGHQIWHGPAANHAEAGLGGALEAIADAHRDEVAGVAACSDYSGDVIFVADPSEAVRAQIAAAGSRYPAATLYVKEVANGLTVLLAAAARVTAIAGANSTLSSVGPDIYSGGLEVGVQPSSWPVSAELRRRVTVAATSGGRVDIPLVFVRQPVASNLDLH